MTDYEMNVLQRDLGRVEAKLDGLTDKFDQHLLVHNEQESRVRRLENFKAWLIGGGATIGAVFGLIKVLLPLVR